MSMKSFWLIMSGLQNLVKITYLISKEAVLCKLFILKSFLKSLWKCGWVNFQKFCTFFTRRVLDVTGRALKGYSKDTRRSLEGHSRDTDRALKRRSGTCILEALGHSKGTWALGYSRHLGTLALSHLRTWTLNGHLGIQAFKALR